MIKLNTLLSDLKGIGPHNIKKLKSLGLISAQDLLLYYPFRFENYGKSKLIADLKKDTVANIIGVVELIDNKKSKQKRIYITEALISDGSGVIKVVWFNQAFLSRQLKAGTRVSLSGLVSENYNQLNMISPEYELLKEDKLIHTQGLVPIYSLTKGIYQKQIRSLIWQVLPLANYVVDFVPEYIIKNLKLLSINEALKQIHFPENEILMLKAKQRIEFNNLFIKQLKSQIIKEEKKRRKSFLINNDIEKIKSFIDELPFTLTADQKKASWEILQDLNKEIAMSRLLQGDVGSGKTIVATIALLSVINNKKQVAFMAPTSILAKQHYQNLSSLLKKHKFKIALLSNQEKLANFKLSEKKKELEHDIITKSDLIIGTQSLLFQKKIPNLALAIVDEQHRFGVYQRHYLANLNNDIHPHFLSISATPIPRSLSLIIYGDLDVSLITQKPKNRKNILTKLVPEEKRKDAYQFIAQKIEKKEQVFVVCPLIDPSDKLGVKSVKQELETLQKSVLGKYKMEILHGKIKKELKSQIMQDFFDKKIDILISTSVIEVGIDVPNASIMLIEGAERFGLAQLHQIRGRVGRSNLNSYCFLFSSKEDLSYKTKQRLLALSKYSDGLSLAKIDLSLRGGGDIYGKTQSGFSDLKIASLFDYELIKKASLEAEKIVKEDKELNKYPQLQKKLKEIEENIHLE